MTLDETQKQQARAKTLASIYTELNKFIQNADYDRAIKAANRVLHMAPDEEKAFHCKIICLIQQSKFNDALQAVQKSPSLAKNLYFEKAYCLYRQNQTVQALDLLKDVELDYHLKELKGQILYRLERFSEAFELYNDIVKNSDDDYGDERETNISAIVAQLNDDDVQKKMGVLRTDTYELCYNLACLHIAKEQYGEAEKLLKQCEKLCQESLEEDGASEEEIDVELALMRIQTGYIYQKQGRIKEAQQLYTSALKLKLDDIALVAVASNNMVVINKDQNVFDSKKKMKSATSDALVHKLIGNQRKYIALNNAILMYYTNHFEPCIKLCITLVDTWPDLALQANLLHALCLIRSSGSVAAAVELLSSYKAGDSEEKLFVELSRAHLLLTQGEQLAACEVLENMGDNSYKPGIVGALISLYLGMKKKETALKIFEKTIEWYRKNKVEGDLSSMWRQAADFHIRNNQPSIAANSLEELVRSSPNDKKAVAQLALAYLQFDKKKAAQLLDKLPLLQNAPKEADIDTFENSNWLSLRKTVAQSDVSPRTPKVDTPKADKTKIKKRKAKKRLPKNYDSNVTPDPERWLPKYERTGFRKKRDRRAKDVIKGSQGVASGQADQFDYSKVEQQEVPNSPGSSVEPSPQPKQQQQKRSQQQKKKNKRR